jgi:ABC-2 type transport system ATP-binding protein
VAIDAGKLLRTAPLASFTERTGQLLVETEEPATPLADRLVARGMQAIADGRTVVVDLQSGADGEYAVFDAVRDEVIGLEMALIRVEHRRHQLEDLFRTGGGDERAA